MGVGYLWSYVSTGGGADPAPGGRPPLVLTFGGGHRSERYASYWNAFFFVDPFKGIQLETSKYTGNINAQDKDGKTAFHHLVTSLPIGNLC